MATNGSTLYKLRTIILHQGENLTCGHYTTVIIYGDTEILIDNEKIYFKKVNLSEGKILKDSYILVYENQNYISNLIDKWTPLVFLLMIFTAHTQEIGCSQLLPLFTNMWKAFTEKQKYDFESILLNFVSSQFARQVTMERFISEKAVNEPAELLSKLLSFLNLHGDHRTSIDFMEQSKCRKCEKYTTKMSAETSITVAEITNSALSKWFTDYAIKFTHVCCKKRIAGKEVKSFPISLPDILIVCSHEPYKEQVISSKTFFKDDVIPTYRKIDEYHAVAALCGKKVVALGEHSSITLEDNMISRSDQLCLEPNACIIFKGVSKSHKFSFNTTATKLTGQQRKAFSFNLNLISHVEKQMRLCLPDLLRKYDGCLGKDQIEEKDEEVLEAVHKLEFKHNLIRNIFFNISRQFGYSCCVIDFASIDIYLNAALSQSISIMHLEDIATKYVLVMTFPKSVVVLDLHDTGIYMVVPDTREAGEYFTHLLL